MSTFSITATARDYPVLPYKRIKDDILGDAYVLSLVFIGSKRAQDLNIATRNKSYTPDVLSFPLTDTHGEIFITPTIAAKNARNFNHSTRSHIGFLYLHALLHLKGFSHGKSMEQKEQYYLTKYKLGKRAYPHTS